MKYPINEIFTSIQGEGPDAGKPANFIRLAGCNLSCHFCDTQHDKKELLTVDQIINQLDQKVPLVVITGGEPFLHDLFDLVKELHRRVFHVSIESNGTLGHGDKLRRYGYYQTIVSPKPGSKLHVDSEKAIAYKYIVSVFDSMRKEDGLPQNTSPPLVGVSHCNVFLQPMDQQDEEKNKLNMAKAADLCIKFGYRLSIQMHKVVGVK